MNLEERQDVFISAFSKDLPDYLGDIEEEALKNDVPIIRKGSQEIIRFLLFDKKPVSILEIGTAVGFSSLFMAHYTSDETTIDTIENYPPRIEKAKENFEKYDLKKRITLFEGDAFEIIKTLDKEYDFIFLDGPKGQYESYLDELLRLLKSGGILVTDNIFKEGDILESRYIVERRDRTIHSRMRDFLFRLKDEESIETVIIPNGDGMTLSIKK